MYTYNGNHTNSTDTTILDLDRWQAYIGSLLRTVILLHAFISNWHVDITEESASFAVITDGSGVELCLKRCRKWLKIKNVGKRLNLQCFMIFILFRLK